MEIKKIFVDPSSDLVSARDKQLALSNAIGTVSHVIFDVAVGSNCSITFRTAAAYIGFLARGFNFIWKQALIARLPVARKYSFLRNAASPLSALGLNGVGWTLSQFQEEHTSRFGWGFCQLPPLASTGIVGHHSLKKLRECFLQYHFRPRDAMQGIAVHSFNLASEVMHTYARWCNWGLEHWVQNKEFFQSKEREAFLWLHELSEPGLKIASDIVLSQNALSKYEERIREIVDTFDRSLREASSLDDVLRGVSEIDNQVITVKSTGVFALRWQDYCIAMRRFADAVSEMQKAWQLKWQNMIKQPFLQQLDQQSQKIPVEDISNGTFVIRNGVARDKHISSFCEQQIAASVEIEKKLENLDMSYLSIEESKDWIQQILPKKCQEQIAMTQKEAFELGQQHIDNLLGLATGQLRDKGRSIGQRAVDESFSRLFTFLNHQENEIRKSCEDAIDSFQPILEEIRSENGSSLCERIERKIGEARESISKYCESQIVELKRVWDLAYSERKETATMMEAMTLWWSMGFGSWFSRIIPHPTTEEQIKQIIRKILRKDQTKDSLENAKQVLSIQEPWPRSGYEIKELCQQVRQRSRRLLTLLKETHLTNEDMQIIRREVQVAIDVFHCRGS